MRDGWDVEGRTAAETTFRRVLETVNLAIEQGWPDEERIRFATPEMTLFFSNDLYRAGGLMEQLERGEVHLVGELSPYNIYRARQMVGAQPFVQPRWNGSESYRAVIVGVDPDVRTLDQLATKLLAQDSRVAISDNMSTSGYWYPRFMLLTHSDIQESRRGFDQIAGQPEDILAAVCNRESNYIAGVVPSYRVDDPEFEEPCADFTEIHRSEPIPQGAFVLGPQLDAMLRERMRLDDLQLAWRDAVAGLEAAALGGFIPRRFEAVEFSA